ncbi:MAG: DUF1353 domain-containing protein [Lentisphaeria bacterium]|nr:DUF1353 domain-containing protein [Lentisphaeria bacterium]
MVKIAVHKEMFTGDIITLLEDLTVTWNGKTVTVPAGFESDGCSVPEFLWDTVSPQLDPRTLRAAIVHDYIYRSSITNWTRLEADELFYDFMVEDGFPKFKAGLAYYGVRWFGSGSWQGEEDR